MQTRNRQSRVDTPAKDSEKPKTPKHTSNKKHIEIHAETEDNNTDSSKSKQGNQKHQVIVNKSSFVLQKQSLTQDYKRLKKQDLIGEGAFGQVYKIVSKDTNEVRAMKLIRKDKMPPTMKEQFLNEINVLKDLDHQNILKIYEFYEDAKNFYLITEFISGCDLLEEINEQEDLTEKQIAYIMEQILSGLNYSHQNNLVHRDIKPENIMIEKKIEKNTASTPKSKKMSRSNSGVNNNNNSEKKETNFDDQIQTNTTPEQDQDYLIKIIDWGTGIKFEVDKGYLTQKCGSIDYASPEVFKGKYDSKCDMWSCGVILYILLSGMHPFGQTTQLSAMEMGEQIKTTKYDFEDEVWEQISDQAKALIKNLLHKNPNKRYSAQEALDHPWFKIQKKTIDDINTQEKKQLTSALRRIKQFRTSSTLQEAAVTYIASHLTTKDDREELRKTFKLMDTNKDGLLSKDEFIKGYEKLMGKEQAIQVVDEIFEKVDIDKSGTISYTEFIAASMNKTNQFTEKKLRDAFRLFDKDGDGQIESNEIKNVLGGSLQNSFENNIWDNVIKEVDINNDGKICFEEFKIFMQKMLESKSNLNSQNNDL